MATVLFNAQLQDELRSEVTSVHRIKDKYHGLHVHNSATHLSEAASGGQLDLYMINIPSACFTLAV